MPTLRLVEVPVLEWQAVKDALTGEEMTGIVLGAIDSIIDALTSPLTPEEEKPTPIGVEVERTITVTGKDYADAAEAVNQLFMERLWSDGMAIVAPTEKAVKRMLTGTSRAPDEVIGKVPPSYAEATVEKIAINAVMGGAKPEYLPVIITAMEVLTDEGFDYKHLQLSGGGSCAPVTVVSGPIGRELNINGGIGLFGSCSRANATIGRSINLSSVNIGHRWPGINRLAFYGQPGEFTGWTIAEHPDNPFDPLGVDFGYGPTDSAVTVYGSYTRGWNSAGSILPEEIEVGLENVATAMEKEFQASAAYHFASYGHTYYLVIVGPTAAASLVEAGWTKDRIRSWLYEHARVPYSCFRVKDRMKLKQNIELGRIPELWDVEDENAMLPVVKVADDIWITVAGPSNAILFFQAIRAHRGTKVIHGATLTEAGR